MRTVRATRNRQLRHQSMHRARYAGCGKTTWVQRHMEKFPAQRYVVLSIAAALQSMRVRSSCCKVIILLSNMRARQPDDQHSNAMLERRVSLNVDLA